MPEILMAQLDKAIEASIAFQAGFITIGECLFILDLAVDWCEFAIRLESQIHGPPDS